MSLSHEAWAARHDGVTLDDVLRQPTWNLIQAVYWILYRDPVEVSKHQYSNHAPAWDLAALKIEAMDEIPLGDEEELPRRYFQSFQAAYDDAQLFLAELKGFERARD